MQPESSDAKPRRVALITGGAIRIGREVALTLARAGMDIAITYRGSADEAHHTVEEIESLGAQAIALQMDVREEASVRDTVAVVEERFGTLDLLVNSAAVFQSVALDTISVEQWDETFDTNARGPFLMSREALPYLKAAQGRIVNLGSLGGINPWAEHAHYCASKAALHMLTQTMAKAFAPDVSVNCVAPGYIHFGEPDKVSERFAAKTPMKRNGSANDVAQAVLFFATGPHFITGQIMTVDGGLGLT
jgi:3-oxoacyl-[acyl-carrier protein] reductase/pteridine reductase